MTARTPRGEQSPASPDLAALRRNAEAATRDLPTWWSEHLLRYHLRVSDGTCPEEDPAFIAACSPSVVLSLLDALEALRLPREMSDSEIDAVIESLFPNDNHHHAEWMRDIARPIARAILAASAPKGQEGSERG